MSNGIWATATDLTTWADRRDAQEYLPRLVRRLVFATVPTPHRVEFRAGEGIQLGGWDGIVETPEGNAFVSEGTSGWEMGTDRNKRGKAEDDYARRCSSPRELDPAQTAFVFVTPRRWANKNDWTAEKKQEGKWLDVRAYDADDLEAWLELAPAVRVWLTRLIGKRPPGVQDIADFWNNWRRDTKPPLSTELLMAGRVEEAGRVIEWLDEEPSALVVQSGSAQEVVVFFSAVLLQLPEEQREPHLSKCVIVRELQSWEDLVSRHHDLCLIPTFPEVQGVGEAIQNGHRVLLPVGSEREVPGHVLRLPRLPSREIEMALIGMGLSENRARVLAEDCGRSLLALRRSLSMTEEMSAPSWAGPELGPLLVPAILAGSWDEGNKADRSVIEQLAGQPYSDVAGALVRLENVSDPPIRCVGGIWQLVSRRDSWRLAARYITSDNLDALERVELSVLGVADPKYDLPPDQRWAASVYGKAPEHSASLRKGLSEALALLGTLGDQLGLRDRTRPEDRAASVVANLLSPDADARMWCSLSGMLPTLAEAAPEAFLNAVVEALGRTDNPLSGMFVDGGLMGDDPHVGLLWALETLAWEPKYLGQVALVLAELAKLVPEGRPQNRPRETLRKLFLCWRCQTPATPEQRLRVLKMLLDRKPDIGWRLLCDLLPKTGREFCLPIHRPHWREWGLDWTPDISNAEIVRNIDSISERLVAAVGADATRWGDLIERLPSLPRQYRDKAVEQMMSLDIAGMEETERVHLWSKLRELLHKHRKFKSAGWAMEPELLDRIQPFYESLEPVNLANRYAWLFSSAPELPDPPERDYDKEQEAVLAARAVAVKEIIASGGVPSLVSAAAEVEVPYILGLTAGRTAGAESIEFELLRRCLGQSDTRIEDLGLGFGAGRFETGGWQWAEQILLGENSSNWSPKQQAGLLCGLPFTNDAWTLLDRCDSEVSSLYWSRVGAGWARSQDDCELAVRRLLRNGRPWVAVETASRWLDLTQGATLPGQLLAEILRAAGEMDPTEELPASSGPLLPHYVELLFGALHDSKDLDKGQLARLEWMYLPVLTSGDRKPQLLHSTLAEDPTFYADVIEAVYEPETDDKGESEAVSEEIARLAGAGYDLLRSWHQVPGQMEDGTVDRDRLRAWLKRAREACHSKNRPIMGDQHIGQVLAYSPCDSHGTWPDPTVRDAIEEIASKEMETGILIGVLNKRGTWTKKLGEGGEQEQTLAESFRKQAECVQDAWPSTATLLRRIADSYERDARGENIRSDLSD